ncbi:MAG: type II toxin-antitoxin system RelE/ParE family toxin [Rhodospirillaceae bacterium]|nr:type II toxin-antitoxin system RelE/ParE family toxin [Rhodospirillaceae bacterium]
MNLLWMPEAREDLAAIGAYIAKNNPAAARDAVLSIVRRVHDSLSSQPGLGRPGRVPGTRELVLTGTPFLVPYRVRAEQVQILRAYHGARRWPDAL